MLKNVLCGLLLALTGMVSMASAAPRISGDYLEARTCDVYTGPCFANGQIGSAGKEALMAWKVDKGSWNDIDLSGLSVVLVLEANDTLGSNLSFHVNPYPIHSVVIVDEKATAAQRDALIKFVRETAPELTDHIQRVEVAPISLKNDHLAGKGSLVAGNLARIETRKMAKGDCVCSNESVFYPPLTKVQNSQPTYSLEMGYQGPGLESKWLMNSMRSSFMATFRQ